MKSPDVIVVLSGGVVKESTPNASVYRSTTYANRDSFGTLGGYARVRAAAILATQYPDAHIITTSAARNSEEPTAAKILSRELEDLGVTPSRIILEEQSTNTREQIKNALELVYAHNWNSVVFVTNEYHIPRVHIMYEQTNETSLDADFVSAEEILIREDAEFGKEFSLVKQTRAYADRLRAEGRGIEALKSNTYKSMDNPEFKTEKEVRILITSVSQKVPLVQAVRTALDKFGGGKIYGGDMNPEAVAKYFVDEFWLMPRTNESEWEKILVYLRENAITHVIPTRDGELDFWASYAPQLRDNGIYVMVSPRETIEKTLDKLLFATWGKKMEFPVIPTVEHITDLPDTQSFVVKERYGAGARSMGLNLSKEEAEKHAERLEAPLFQPYVRGVEYSVDVYVSKEGKRHGAVVRIRKVVVDGESQVTEVVDHERIAEVCVRMAEAIGIRGHAVFQMFETESGELYVIECNGRFGGASSASIAAGLDTFYWFLLETAGAELPPFNFPKHITMVRYKADRFYDRDI